VTRENEQAAGFAARMAFALEKDPLEGARRTHVTLKVVSVTLVWLVTVPLLVVAGLTGVSRGHDAFVLAAVLNMAIPFAASVVATRNHRFGVAGCYIVVTLLMIIPSLAIAHL
jgi:hypothetical protein